MRKLSNFSSYCYAICAAAVLLLSGIAQASAADAAQVVFVAGDVKSDNKALALNGMIAEGARIDTGVDGFVYLKTIDNGFLVVRPNSAMRIVAYHVDKQNPQNTRIKLELLNGVARSISGDAVKLSRQNFRFNTPVAAIGVRGTDFTVFTDQAVSRVSVLSGGVVVSGFGGACTPAGNGPCEGVSAVELFATQHGKLLQITKDQMKPNVFNGNGASPDAVSPPRNDEPGVKAGVAMSLINGVPGNGGDTILGPIKNATLPEYIQSSGSNAKALDNSIIWGRWTMVAGQAPNLDVRAQEPTQVKLIAANPYYAIYQSRSSEWQVPIVGSIGFSLTGGDAYIKNEVNNIFAPASIENGKLQLDFAKASFATSFDLVAPGERFAMRAQGTISADGHLYGDLSFVSPTNMSVNGVVTAEKGGSAAYIFQRRLDNERVSYGVTYWAK